MKPRSSTLTRKSHNKASTDRFVFSGERLEQVLMPVGGLGVGSIGFNGAGGFENFSVQHRPDTTALPDGHRHTPALFAAIRVVSDNASETILRVVEGPIRPNRIYNHGLYAQGLRKGCQNGFPRFESAQFTNRFPFGVVDLKDKKVPLRVQIKAYNPFIPGDSHHSSIPVLRADYQFTNASKKPVSFQFMLSMTNLLAGWPQTPDSVHSQLGKTGVLMRAGDASPAVEQSTSCALKILNWKKGAKVKTAWYRGGWFDGISALWREFQDGQFRARTEPVNADIKYPAGGSAFVDVSLSPGESVVVPVAVSWYFPNAYWQWGAPGKKDGEPCACEPNATPLWHPYYAAHWKDAGDVINYVEANDTSLTDRTAAFQAALASTTLPDAALDAIISNLAIIKSPTIIRLDNGGIWGWEGCFSDRGCCAGSCTHVWNYAQALCHLFPDIERSLRDLELKHSMGKDGKVGFRAAIPFGETRTLSFHAAADGQLGGIMKVFRDWRISGDADWLRDMYPLAKKSMDYCINTWDPDRKGLVVEPHHNTYDIEFWGPDGLCSGMYLGALCAMADMADALGSADAAEYRALADRCAQLMEKTLYNGEFFVQKVQYKGLRDTSFEKTIATIGKTPTDEERLLKKEGPKYQYGSGCLADGMLGLMKADFFGIETPLDRKKIRSNLKAIYKYNFRMTLAEHSNPQRPGYALGSDAGLLMCSWPAGGKPLLPFPYSDEVWTGVEYQVAAHLINEGYVNEGLTIVRAARDRYDGSVRNPFDEYECGSYYARAMSSFALLQAYSGVRYSPIDKVLHVAIKTDARPFRAFFAVESGFGVLSVLRQKSKTVYEIKMIEGRMDVDTLRVETEGRIEEYAIGETIESEPLRLEQ